MTFRVNLNLECFFKDHRKSVLVSIDKNLKNVKCLEDKIMNIFQIRKSIYLTTEDEIFIPSLEDISIILPTDKLIAFPIGRTTDITPTKKSNIPKENGEIVENSIIPKKKVEIVEKSYIPKENVELFVSGIETSEAKKKRKRKRPKKKTTEGLSFEEVGEELNKIFNKHEIVPFNNELPTKRKHIRFEEGKPNPSARIIRAIEHEHKINEYETSEVLHLEKVDSALENCSSTIIKADETNQLNGTNELAKYANGLTPKNEEEKKPESSLELLRLNSNSLNLPTITEIPNENDVILFKYLRIGANYIPEISDIIIGMVETVDRENNNLKIFILAGNQDISNNDGKFAMPDNEEQDKSSLLLNWKELIEPKQVKLD